MKPKKKEGEKLTLKQESFCREYIKTGNYSDAYRAAYDCSKTTDESINQLGFRIFNDVKIKLRIKELMKPQDERFKIELTDIQKQLDAIINSDIRDYVSFKNGVIKFKNFEELTDRQALAIEKIKYTKAGIELCLHGKSWSIDRICKLMGYDKPIKVAETDTEGNDKNPIHISIINTDQLPKSEDDVNLQ